MFHDFKLLIIEAKYGAKDSFFDVKNIISKMIINDTLSICASNELAGDPINGVPKKLYIEYKFEGDKNSKYIEVNESETISIKYEN